jgi:transcription elongation factor GreA
MSNSKVVMLSKKGMKELKKSVRRLERRHEQALADVRDLDGVNDHESRLERVEKLAQLEIIDSELSEKQLILANAKQFPRKRDALRVALGSVVELIDMQGRIVRYTIVDSIEANPSDGRISAESPLGQSLLGKTIKETVKWGNDMRARQMKLVAIH